MNEYRQKETKPNIRKSSTINLSVKSGLQTRNVKTPQNNNIASLSSFKETLQNCNNKDHNQYTPINTSPSNTQASPIVKKDDTITQTETSINTFINLLSPNSHKNILSPKNIVKPKKNTTIITYFNLNNLPLKNGLISNPYISPNIKTKMNNACMGRILVDGNFQVIVPDSFAFMEHACGLTVRGLIKSGRFYSNYWNNKEVSRIDCMRSPLTYLSEHLVVDLQNDSKLRDWFQYDYTGIITNIYDEYTLRFAGSDFDYDILATTSNEVMVNSTYADDVPVVGKVEKPKKWLFEPRDLQVADKFTFGSIIGQITNNVTTIRCLMSDYSEDSREYQTLINRMRMGCKLQSLQID